MQFLFFLFTGVALVASLFVVFSTNPVHSVLSLIVVFCSSSMVLLLLTVDFLSILFVVVYVGAIAVLFLFVIMMLNIKLVQINESVLRWVPLSFLLTLIFVSEVLYVFTEAFTEHLFLGEFGFSWLKQLINSETLSLFGGSLYFYFLYSFVLAAFVLLIALMGAIVLTISVNKGSRRQFVYKQVGRNVLTSVVFYK
jgi:NADH-quinone oxidoreductase subunit J